MGFLHRDVEPADVLGARAMIGGRRRATLADFGVSSPIGRGEDAGSIAGTAA